MTTGTTTIGMTMISMKIGTMRKTKRMPRMKKRLSPKNLKRLLRTLTKSNHEEKSNHLSGVGEVGLLSE